MHHVALVFFSSLLRKRFSMFDIAYGLTCAVPMPMPLRGGILRWTQE
jgi:hypothetical protein